MFCSPLYSVSPDRRFYEAMKRTRERRFLCARKQLSGGLFTDYNGNPLWRLGEPKLVEQFLNLTLVWRAGKAPAGSEKFNRDLLLECAGRLAASMQAIFGEEIKPHLFMLAQKLGKKQKLAYSRMSNNCQDFCNGLLDYDSYIHPMVSAMYPFIPVGLSADIEQAADDRSLSYLQSFVKPLQYPIQGGRSRRMMLGSAITMYSSSAQNDADLIDHVYSVRFGYDSENHFSLGFTLGPKRSSGDPYLLKDEEMSCSDRFAASNLPLSTEGLASCSLADHLLDCPQDNLSILQTHLLRQKKYYIDEDGEFLVNLGPKAWMKNRLEILRRLSLMNAFLAEIAKHFQACCWELLPQVGVVNVKTLMKTWRPANTIFSRAWHLDKRDGNKLYYAPDLDFGDGEMSNYKAVGFFTLGTPLFETHRQVLDGENLFMTRLKTLKSLLSSRLAGKDEVWSPWECCTCPECNIHRLQCLRIIFDTDKADSQLLRERLEYYRLVFAGKELPG
ncbi:hypothetical protein P175DRAFT_0497709 [Aspergillus ochraceoroseus IBT 24754]|uniref:Uncharacterized protein n=1 Tax=Aspergillus ochraceoroseus IBT 24754 TaxID=1392256 RepID=A0A2T5M7U1_9EURO|nr:uncharacterized protein P175DRAFT_0497709 [Aspergillus ochraceoroseus IBT 24754]PTU24587.1 hypothetical protein P175DRAFT_0497709 [Aspergillus ochraceoroseus IBT 24754]